MDEPFQGVDAVTERAIVSLLQELRAAGKRCWLSTTICKPFQNILTGSHCLMCGELPVDPYKKFSMSKIFA
jgi:ABC-type uncharacterized transport system ATPase subunit